MPQKSSQAIGFVDSHTAGEPTRVIVDGVAEPEGRSMAEKRSFFAGELDGLRRAVVCEPRGHEALVGALLCEPCAPDCVTGVIFFNNVGVLHGCLHGTMGLAVTLHHLGRIGPGLHRIDTPTGVVEARLDVDGATVSVKNVPSYRLAERVAVSVAGYGTVRGDIAWGGNWFFLADAPAGLSVDAGSVEDLAAFARELRRQLRCSGVTGADGQDIDHIELFAPPCDPETADSKNFVLCPGNAYDRSPCGTGTSAKLACLAAEGKLLPGQEWRQAGILDTLFSGTIEAAGQGGRGIVPTVRGQAYVTAVGELVVSRADPFSQHFTSALRSDGETTRPGKSSFESAFP